LFRLKNRDQLREASLKVVTTYLKLSICKFKIGKLRKHPEKKQELELIIKKLNKFHVELNAQRRMFRDIRNGGGSAEFEWPVDELLRQLKIKLETDVGEIQRYVSVMHAYN